MKNSQRLDAKSEERAKVTRRHIVRMLTKAGFGKKYPDRFFDMGIAKAKRMNTV
ncbi:MAG: hypothetical protein HS132_04735 [Planctomycetia bacterium]|nr:hypothetical protein [Planctomycetia bacterium]